MLQLKRKEKELSQKQLAELANINVRTLQHYEQGSKDINGAKLETLIDLSNVLDCRVRDILTNDELIEKCKRAKL